MMLTTTLDSWLTGVWEKKTVHFPAECQTSPGQAVQAD